MNTTPEQWQPADILLNPSSVPAEPIDEHWRGWLLELQRHSATHERARAWLGLPPDPSAQERIARRFRVPAWSAGAISIVDALFLYDLVQGLRPRRVLELGTGAGVSTAALLLALADAGLSPRTPAGRSRMVSIDRHTSCYFDRTRPVGAAVAELVPQLRPWLELRTGTAADADPNGERFDLMFIDGDHRHPWPCADLLAVQRVLAAGAVVVLHDIDLPARAAAHERRTGERVSWHEHGPGRLFSAWPMPKLAGVGEGSNIGLLTMPAGRRATPADLASALDAPWECRPPEHVLAMLGRAAPPLGAAA